MICNICGRQIENEHANFCENCGESLRDNKGFEYREPINPTPVSSTQPREVESNEISLKTFLGVMLLQIIPGFGLLIYVVVLFTWVFSNKRSKTHKNFAKASLIMALLSLLASVYLVSTVLSTI